MFSILAGALTTGNILIEANDGDNATINKMEALKTVAVRDFTLYFMLAYGMRTFNIITRLRLQLQFRTQP